MQESAEDFVTCPGTTGDPGEGPQPGVAGDPQTAAIIDAAQLWVVGVVCLAVSVAAAIGAARFVEDANCASLSVLREAYSHALLSLAQE